MGEVQQRPKGISGLYLERGLRYLRRFQKDEYDRCVTELAQGIRAAAKNYGKIKPLNKIDDFPNIPNAFAGGDWQEAATPSGWKRGPEVANFVFVAETADDSPDREARHGAVPAEWRPYLPPEITTILDYARKVKQSNSCSGKSAKIFRLN